MKAKKLEDKLKEIKRKHYDEMSLPQSAFIIFDEEEGAQRALSAEKKKIKVCDHPLDFKKPTEPSDIIWENRHTPKTRWAYRAVIASIILGLILAVSFVVIYVLQTWSSTSKYGNINCENIYKIYPNQESLKKYAIKEWISWKTENFDTILDGSLKCFCEKEKKTHGYYDISKRKYSSPDIVDQKGRVIEEDICFDYLVHSYWKAIVNQAIGFGIVMINYFSRYVLVILIEWIGYATQSALNNAITNAIFVTQFFNTAIILLFIKSNLNESGIPFLGRVFNGDYYDFDSNWFDEIGSSIAFAMFYSAIWPIIEFVFFHGIRVAFRLLDRMSLCPSKYRTKKTTVQQYVDLYGGPEYLIYWKYSRITNMAWVTFMFGPGIPILYPTFLLALLIQYISERL